MAGGSDGEAEARVRVLRQEGNGEKEGRRAEQVASGGHLTSREAGGAAPAARHGASAMAPQ